MDTQYDFLTPEFLHLLFFEQKNLIIFPYVDIENLRVLKMFITGYKIIEIQSNDLFNIKDVCTLSIEESDSEERPFFLISNLTRENVIELSKINSFHGILNSNEDLSDLELPNQTFVLYNKKRQEFLNYSLESQDLDFEKKIFLEKEKNGSITKILEKIHSTAKEILSELNRKNSPQSIAEILKDYSESEAKKILGYTQKFFSLRDDIVKSCDLDHKEGKSRTHRTEDGYSEEYHTIISSNKFLSKEFIQLLHDYRMKKVNASNLEINELFSPEALYIYLREHHWKDGIPESFLKDWIKMEYTGYPLNEQDILDFEMLLNELAIPTRILMEVLDHITTTKEKVSPPLLQEPKEKNPHTDQIQEQKKDHPIPNIQDFPKFKTWILQKLDELEREYK
jgi:hypothetical protein